MKVLDYQKSFREIHDTDDFRSREFHSGPLDGYKLYVYYEDPLPFHFHILDKNNNHVCAILFESPEYYESHVPNSKKLTREQVNQLNVELRSRAYDFFPEHITAWWCFYCDATNRVDWGMHSNIKVDKHYKMLRDIPDYSKLNNED